MIDPILITILLGLFIGLVLALTGAGGAILSLPLLVLFLDIKMIEAAPISLIAISISAGIAALIGLRAGIVRYKAAGILATFGILCAPIGVYVAHHLSEQTLAMLFSAVLFVVAWRSFKNMNVSPLLITNRTETINGKNLVKKIEPACALNPATSKLFWTAHCTVSLISTGGLSGFLSGLLGVGGGFIIVPTLQRISNLETKIITATSLAVIALVSIASTISYAGNGTILWSIALPFTISMLSGMFLGRWLHDKIPNLIRMLMFSLLSLFIGLLMLLNILFGH